MYLNDFKCVNNVSNTFHKEDLRFARSSSASAPGRRPAINDARAMAEAVQPPRTVQPRCGTVQPWSSWHFQSFSVAGFHWTIIEPNASFGSVSKWQTCRSLSGHIPWPSQSKLTVTNSFPLPLKCRQTMPFNCLREICRKSPWHLLILGKPM
jgi:hypothetical protein